MDALTGLGRQTDARDGLMGRMFKIQKNQGCSKLKYQWLAVAPSQRRFALTRTIVCCGASIVAHFARKVRATNT